MADASPLIDGRETMPTAIGR